MIVRPNNTEFAIGIIFVIVGAFLLYTEYNLGYWGIVALGLIFIIKNWSVARRPRGSRPGFAEGQRMPRKPKSDNITNERINY